MCKSHVVCLEKKLHNSRNWKENKKNLSSRAAKKIYGLSDDVVIKNRVSRPNQSTNWIFFARKTYSMKPALSFYADPPLRNGKSKSSLDVVSTDPPKLGMTKNLSQN